MSKYQINYENKSWGLTASKIKNISYITKVKNEKGLFVELKIKKNAHTDGYHFYSTKNLKCDSEKEQEFVFLEIPKLIQKVKDKEEERHEIYMTWLNDNGFNPDTDEIKRQSNKFTIIRTISTLQF